MTTIALPVLCTGELKIKHLDLFFTKYSWLISMRKQNLKTKAEARAEKSATENCIREKNNEQIQEQISNVWLILIQSADCQYQVLYKNFRMLSQAVSEISLTEK